MFDFKFGVKFAFQETPHFSKFEDGDFKYDNSFSKPQLKNTQISHFWF